MCKRLELSQGGNYLTQGFPCMRSCLEQQAQIRENLLAKQ